MARGKTALEYGATQIVNYRDGDIVEQILDMNHGPVDKVIVAGGDVDTMDQAIRMLKPGGAIGNVNYLGEGDYVRIPRVEWGCGMGHKRINGGLMCGAQRVRCGEPQLFQTRAQRSGARLRAWQKYFFDTLKKHRTSSGVFFACQPVEKPGFAGGLDY